MRPNPLETAIRADDLAKIRELIAAGADVSAPFADGTKPIVLAAREGRIAILRALAAAGPGLDDLEELSVEERLALFVGASLDTTAGDDLLSTRELTAWAERAVGVQMDERLVAQIAAWEGPVFRAVRTGDLDLLKEGIAAGDDIDPVREVLRDTPLTLAVQEGDEEMILELLAAGANPSRAGFSTPLSLALPELWLVKLLLDAGADPYGRGLDRTTALERAVWRAVRPAWPQDSPLLVRIFLEAGVDPARAESFEAALLVAARAGEAWEVYQELLPHYSPEIAEEFFGELADEYEHAESDGGFLQWGGDLRFAASTGELEELRGLLDKRWEGKRRDEAAEELGLAVREVLLRLGAEPGPQFEAVRLLIEAGADLDAARTSEKRRGSTPLAAAAESWHPQSTEAMRLLLEAGAGADGRGSFGRTPLMYAVHLAWCHEAPLKTALPRLLEAGADPNLEDELGLTAWSLAQAPLIEAEERPRLGGALPEAEPFFEGPELAERMSEAARRADRRRDRLERCRDALALLEGAGAEPRCEAELRLVLAAAAGDARRVAELLAEGARADARDPAGRPAVVLAAESGDLETLDLLIGAGCDLEAKQVPGPSALEAAVGRGDAAMTRRLLDAGANPIMMTTFGRRYLAAAEEAGAAEVVAMIRDALPPEMANLDRDIEREIADDDLYYSTLDDLPRQAALGDLAKVREMLAVEDVEVDSFDRLRRTALSAAAEAGQVEMVRELLAAGADPGLCNRVVGSPRSTPLACAAISPSAERGAVLGLLLEAGAHPDQRGADGRTALMHAVERDVGFFGRTGGFALSTRTLIEAGADLEARDPYGLTAWMRATSLAASVGIEEVEEGYREVARVLAEAGASTAGQREVNLVWAVVEGEAGEVRRLLAAGADPDARRHDGATALMLAVRGGEEGIARALLDAGCDVEARQWVDRGPTAMDAAAEAGDQALVRLLEKAGAGPPTPETTSRSGSTSPLLPE